MADTSSIVAGAISEARDAGTFDGAGDVNAGIDSAPVAAEPVATPVEATPAAPDAATTPAAPPIDPEDVDAELTALAARRDNRIPQPRVAKMVEKARAKATAAHQVELKTVQDKLIAAEQKANLLDSLDKLATNDPARYIELLGRANPAYREFVRQQKVAETVAPTTAAAVAADPMPAPDAQFPDGSKGYSEQGLAALQSWTKREAKREATDEVLKQVNERFGPLEKQWRAQQTYAVTRQHATQTITDLRSVWGDLLDKHDAEIGQAVAEDNVQAQRLGRPVTPADRIVARVLTPKLRGDREALRTEWTKELNARPAAAAKSVPAAAASAPVFDGPRTTADIVREAMANAR